MFGTGASSRCQPQLLICVTLLDIQHTLALQVPGMPQFGGVKHNNYCFLGCPIIQEHHMVVSSQSRPMPIPSCVTSSSEQPILRGVIKSPKKLSQKHQRLWEAQSAENVQLWNMIGQSQGELADCKGRLIKLEAEISSLRSATTNEPTVEVGNGNGGIMARGQPMKQGRSRRSVAPVGSQPPLRA